MKRGRQLFLWVVSALVLTWAAAAAADNVWVSSDGATHAIHGDGHMMLIEDGEGLDLSELADGETRVLGSGDSAVTVTRNGNVATITRDPVGDRERIDVSCQVDRDTCRVILSEDEPDRVMIVVRKERVCENGEGDCDEAAWIEDTLGGGERIVLRKVVHCDGEGECSETEDLAGSPHVVRVESLGGTAPEGRAVFVGSGAHALVGPDVILLERGDSVLLRCPEGDATLSVKKDEAEQVFLCPKHSVPLERVEPRLHKMRMSQPDGTY